MNVGYNGYLGVGGRDGTSAGMGRVHLDSDLDLFLFYRLKSAPDPFDLDFLDPDSLGLTGPRVLTGFFLILSFHHILEYM